MHIRLFLKHITLFASPLLAWLVVVVLIDPFNYFRASSIIREELKEQNSASLNSLLYNMLLNVHEPSANLIIGDSRARDLPITYINSIADQKYFILGANALKLNESIDLYYFASELISLKHVVFTLNFNQFNEYAYADRVNSIRSMIDNPLLYIFDPGVAEAGYYVCRAAFSGSDVIDSTPQISEDEWWNFIINARGNEHYSRYSYPSKLYERIEKLVQDAHEKGVRITFVNVPNHADFQKRIREYGLESDYLRFKTALAALNAEAIDYDYVNAITTNRNSFRDPLHTNIQIGRLISSEIFTGKYSIGKRMDSKWINQCSNYLF
jgi:hypothetical protein